MHFPTFLKCFNCLSFHSLLYGHHVNDRCCSDLKQKWFQIDFIRLDDYYSIICVSDMNNAYFQSKILYYSRPILHYLIKIILLYIYLLLSKDLC